MTDAATDVHAALERDGFTTVDLLEPDGTAELQAIWDELEAEVKAYPFSATILSRDVAYRTRVDEAVRAVLAPAVDRVLDDVRLAYGAFVAKRADENSAVPIHQDLSFVDEDRYVAINVWTPLVDVDAGNGCLRVLRGSHRLTDAPRGTDFRIPYLEHLRDEDFEDVALRAGQACLMTGPVYHQSAPNRSGLPRVAAAAVAVPAHAQLLHYYAEPGQPVVEGQRAAEVFAVDDAFYRSHTLGSRPAGLKPFAVERRAAAPVSGREEVLARLRG